MFLMLFLNKIILITLKNYYHSILKILGGRGCLRKRQGWKSKAGNENIK
jgi:hypothetical protein